MCKYRQYRISLSSIFTCTNSKGCFRYRYTATSPSQLTYVYTVYFSRSKKCNLKISLIKYYLFNSNSMLCQDPWAAPTWSIQNCTSQAIFFALETKGRGVSHLYRRRQSSGRFGKLTHRHFLDLFASKEMWSHCSMLRGQSQFMIYFSYFRIFLEQYVLFQSCQRWSATWFK
jgi:hypothetical protein